MAINGIVSSCFAVNFRCYGNTSNENRTLNISILKITLFILMSDCCILQIKLFDSKCFEQFAFGNKTFIGFFLLKIKNDFLSLILWFDCLLVCFMCIVLPLSARFNV